MCLAAKSSGDAGVSSLPSAPSIMSSTADAFDFVDVKATSHTDTAPSASPPSYSPPANPPVHLSPSPSFPEGCVYDPLLPRDQYVDDSYTLRTGVLFDALPSGPLLPAFLPQRTTGKTYFYCVTRGLKVGVVTDVTEAVAQTAGVSHAMNFKVSSHSAALEYFNQELAKGNVKLCQRRGHRPQFVCSCVTM